MSPFVNSEGNWGSGGGQAAFVFLDRHNRVNQRQVGLRVHCDLLQDFVFSFYA